MNSSTGMCSNWSNVMLQTVAKIAGEMSIIGSRLAWSARISLHVKEGDRVEQGALLAVLDNEPFLLASVNAARAQVGARSAALGQVTTSVLASRNELEAQVARAQVALDTAALEFRRTETLLKSGGTTTQALDQRRAQRDEALRDMERLQATQARYGTGTVYAQADAVLASSNINAARADLARATADLEKAYVRAPITGTILTISADPGENPGAKGILTLGNIEKMKIEVDVYETQIGRISLGDQASATALALSQPLRGTVAKIGLEVGKQDTIDPNPAANTDARVVKVTIALDEASSALARRFTNLQVTAEFAQESGR